MERHELLTLYEARGGEETYRTAALLYEEALATYPDDAELVWEYGYLQECRGRFAIRDAVASYERAIALDPTCAKARFQLISARAALLETDAAIALYEARLAERRDDPAEYRFLAHAYLVARDYDRARQVVEAGLALAPDDATLVEQQGDVFAATGRPDEALLRWRRAAELDPDTASPLQHGVPARAREQARGGRRGVAVADLVAPGAQLRGRG